jgi:hypothetical protein
MNSQSSVVVGMGAVMGPAWNDDAISALFHFAHLFEKLTHNATKPNTAWWRRI